MNNSKVTIYVFIVSIVLMLLSLLFYQQGDIFFSGYYFGILSIFITYAVMNFFSNQSYK